jgi:hypothetical protein
MKKLTFLQLRGFFLDLQASLETAVPSSENDELAHEINSVPIRPRCLRHGMSPSIDSDQYRV